MSGGGWTLAARFSNADSKNWMRDDAYWWYDIQSSQGSPTSTSNNYDMISETFWKVKGDNIKITRSDDGSHSALLRTYSNCLSYRTLRGFLSSYGRFTYSNPWSNNYCRGSCPVYFGGRYSSMPEFNQAHCSSNIQGSSRIGFWCQWSTGDGSVMMFGGGGSGCSRADHGIGITEDNDGSFDSSGTPEYDFGVTSNASIYSHPILQYQEGREENKDGSNLLVQHRVRKGVGNDLNELRDKAKKANSAYKWIKVNWKKIFVIIVAIFALIVVVGIYRRCFSDSGSSNIRVLASISHENKSLSVHDSAVVWTTDVTQNSFRICVLESGLGTNGSAVVNWIAFRGTPSGAFDGAASFNAFTSGTKCERRFPSVPKVLATVRHTSISMPQDAMNMWIEELQEDHFRVCLREVKTFDGKHQNIQVDWLAFTQGTGEMTFHGKLQFENDGAPLERDNFAFCKVLNYTETFYAPPVVMVTVSHLYDSNNVYSVKPENNVLNAWIEEITISTFRVCVTDLAGKESQHDPVTVHYTVIGDLDPCINVSCKYFAVCKAFGPRDARYICVDNCPSFEEPVCSSNGTTYDNECVFQREMCHLRANFTVYHPGDCTGFPSQKGRHRLSHNPVWAEAVCEQVPLEPYVFYPDKPV
ncbi:unnamed protein product [Porites evermanni]|uniref:Kazal-like domain-containing protein n=1 Tax=Porites evermanni TaxID=104178 RepID=A0ABN8LUS1_9CNID|nr:unnamed protein product [Porites evermanni]